MLPQCSISEKAATITGFTLQAGKLYHKGKECKDALLPEEAVCNFFEWLEPGSTLIAIFFLNIKTIGFFSKFYLHWFINYHAQLKYFVCRIWLRDFFLISHESNLNQFEN